MSTKAPRRLGLSAALCLAATTVCACATRPPEEPVGRFSELRIGRAAPRAEAPAPAPVAPLLSPLPRTPPALRPRLPAPDTPAAVAPVALATAQARVSAFLDRAGFALESRPEGGGALLSATRMGPPHALDGEAVCALEALRRPTLSSTDLTVRLIPAPGGVQLQTHVSFVELDTKLLSGELARETCRSNGALEAAILRVARGG